MHQAIRSRSLDEQKLRFCPPLMLIVSRMKKTILLINMLLYSSLSCGAGPAGEIVSLNCSYAINTVLKYIKEKKLKINVTLKEGSFACITPNKKEIIIRLQSPKLKVTDKKYYFIINAHSYEIISTSFSR